MGNRLETNVKVGLFVTIGMLLLMLAIILLGGADSIFTRRNHYFVYLDNVDGIMVGSKVVLNGIRVGIVDHIEMDRERGNIQVRLSVEKSFQGEIRKDTLATIATQGVLGDKYVSLTAGSHEQTPLPADGEIVATSGGGGSLLSGTGDLMKSLSSVAQGMDRLIQTLQRNNRSDTLFEGLATTAKNMSQITEKLNHELDGIKIKSTMYELHAILAKINNGQGTVGALVNDPGLYDDVKNLVGGANRNRIMRNLIRQTIKKNESDGDKK